MTDENERITTSDIVRNYIKEHGFDGLCNPGLECGCLLSDLVPCGDGIGDCQPGYKNGDEDGNVGCFLEKHDDKP